MSVEFRIIQDYFDSQQAQRQSPHWLEKGIGDDCALLNLGNTYTAITIDTLVAGVHFFHDDQALDIGYKSLAVSLSDIAAMGAKPAWFTLALTMPMANETWIRDFAAGLFELAEEHCIHLVGGDTTSGPLSITVQAAGLLGHRGLRRAGAEPGDYIYLTGPIGDAAAALSILKNKASSVESVHLDYLLRRLRRPQPQVDMGLSIAPIATAAIDISDGLFADLGHVCQASGVNAVVHCDQLPLSNAFRAVMGDEAQSLKLALTGGDDYQLCFTIPAHLRYALNDIAKKMNVDVTEIGEIVSGESQSIRWLYQGSQIDVSHWQGYSHFD